ncbi:MAG: hypothetical protein AAGF13_10525 [Pseudomonadota bacterium]
MADFRLSLLVVASSVIVAGCTAPQPGSLPVRDGPQSQNPSSGFVETVAPAAAPAAQTGGAAAQPAAAQDCPAGSELVTGALGTASCQPAQGSTLAAAVIGASQVLGAGQ